MGIQSEATARQVISGTASLPQLIEGGQGCICSVIGRRNGTILLHHPNSCLALEGAVWRFIYMCSVTAHALPDAIHVQLCGVSYLCIHMLNQHVESI